MKLIIKTWYKENFPHVPSKINFYIAVIFITIVVMLFITNFIDDFLVNLITEIIGTVVTIYIIERIVKKEWYSIEVQLERKIKKILKITVNRFYVCLNLTDLKEKYPNKVTEEIEISWEPEVSERVRIENEIMPVMKKYLRYLDLLQWKRLLEWLEKIKKDLDRIQQKYILERISPKIIYILEDFEDNIEDLIQRIDTIIAHVPKETSNENLDKFSVYKVYLRRIKEGLLKIMRNLLELDSILVQSET